MKHFKFEITQVDGFPIINEIINDTGYNFIFDVAETPNIRVRTENEDAIFEGVFIEDGVKLLPNNRGCELFLEGGESTYLVLDTYTINPDQTTNRDMNVLNKVVFTIYFPNLTTEYTPFELSTILYTQSVLVKKGLRGEASKIGFPIPPKKP